MMAYHKTLCGAKTGNQLLYIVKQFSSNLLQSFNLIKYSNETFERQRYLLFVIQQRSLHCLRGLFLRDQIKLTRCPVGLLEPEQMPSNKEKTWRIDFHKFTQHATKRQSQRHTGWEPLLNTTCCVGKQGKRVLLLKEEEVLAVGGKVGDQGAHILIACGPGKDSSQIVKDSVGTIWPERKRGGGTKHSSLI